MTLSVSLGHYDERGLTMNKRVAAIALTACMMLSVTACGGRPKATVIQSMETFGTTQNTTFSEETAAATAVGTTIDKITLSGTGDDTYSFSFDSDIITYTGQGGNFFLVGSSPTECYLHIMVQDGDSTYEDARNAEAGRIAEEFTLESGRRAFIYKTSDANTSHIIIEANDIASSGNCLVKVTVGSAGSWLYSVRDIANMVGNGF